MNYEYDPKAPEHIIRRDFLKQLSAAGAAAMMAGEPRSLSANDVGHFAHSCRDGRQLYLVVDGWGDGGSRYV